MTVNTLVKQICRQTRRQTRIESIKTKTTRNSQKNDSQTNDERFDNHGNSNLLPRTQRAYMRMQGMRPRRLKTNTKRHYNNIIISATHYYDLSSQVGLTNYHKPENSQNAFLQSTPQENSELPKEIFDFHKQRALSIVKDSKRRHRL